MEMIGVSNKQAQKLTPREKEILRQLATGKMLKQVVGNQETLKNQMSAIRKKLKANTTTHAVVIAISRRELW